MRIIATGDWHITNRKPRNRKDVCYLSTILGKIKSILKYAVRHDIHYILQPGDFFDSHSTPYSVIRDVIILLKKYKIKILCVAGQHDMRFHNPDNINTPLTLLASTGLVEIISPKTSWFIQDGVDVYGASWEQKSPTPFPDVTCPILLIHRMIIKSKNDKLWDGQREYWDAGTFLLSHNFKFIVSGDNHTSFSVSFPKTSRHAGKRLINCGSLMRSSIKQKDHKPYFVVIDTKADTVTKVLLKVAPVEEVLDFSAREIEKETQETLTTFADNFPKVLKMVGQLSNTNKLNYQSRVAQIIRETNVPTGVIKIIEEIFGEKL